MNITNFLTPFFIFKNQNIKKTHLKRSNYRFFDFLYSGPTLNALCLTFFRSRKIDLHSEIPRVVTKMSKMLPFVTSCNRNVTIFFPKKWIFLGARCAGNLKMGRKKKCHSSDVTKKKNKLFYIEMENPKISHFWERGSRAHGDFFKKNGNTVTLGFCNNDFL